MRLPTNEAPSRPPSVPWRSRGHALLMLCALVLGALAWSPRASAQEHQPDTAAAEAEASGGRETASQAAAQPGVSYHAPLVFTLRTGIATGRMVYIGVGGDIDGQVNPTLMVHEGELVQINLINGEGAEHDVVIDQYAARSSLVVGKNASRPFPSSPTRPASSPISARSPDTARPAWKA